MIGHKRHPKHGICTNHSCKGMESTTSKICCYEHLVCSPWGHQTIVAWLSALSALSKGKVRQSIEHDVCFHTRALRLQISGCYFVSNGSRSFSPWHSWNICSRLLNMYSKIRKKPQLRPPKDQANWTGFCNCTKYISPSSSHTFYLNNVYGRMHILHHRKTDV